MNSKQGSLLMCIILFSGLLFPVIAHSTNSFQNDAQLVMSDAVALADTTSSQNWHHDLSNTSYFPQYMNWPMDWWYEDYLVTTGNMNSDGNSVSFSGIPAASSPVRWHGPIFAYNFIEPLTLGNFQDGSFILGFNLYRGLTKVLRKENFGNF